MELPEPPSDEEVERIARKLGVPTAQRDTLPLEGDGSTTKSGRILNPFRFLCY